MAGHRMSLVTASGFRTGRNGASSDDITAACFSPTQLWRRQMGKRNWFAHTAQSLIALAGCTLAASASALYVEMFAIGDFVPGSSGGCGGNDISDWPGMAQ